MMFSTCLSGALLGIEASLVEVQCDVSRGLPGFKIVGLPEKEVQESRERIRSAIKNTDFAYPAKRITANLAPADVKKEGVGMDLPLAVGILKSTKQLEDKRGSDHILLGELSLDGEIRSVKGVLPIALQARSEGVKKVLLPAGNATEAAIVRGIEAIPVGDLKEAISYLQGELEIAPYNFDHEKFFGQSVVFEIDFNDIKGQEQAKRALTVSAAGGHNVLMVGPPGSGKSMLVKRLPTILPRLTFEEAIEVTKIYSIMGLLNQELPIVNKRQVRAPHHTISYAGMVGGGHGSPLPGEISLAHNGILFLDELPEFNRNVLETLRQPLEDRKITISRASLSVTFPASFTLVAAMNPCPCGHLGDTTKRCRCTPYDIRRYRKKISGPFLDRMDIFIEVPRLTKEELMGKPSGQSSNQIREKVNQARRVQKKRFERESDSLLFTNAQMRIKDIRKFCKLTEAGKSILKKAIDHFSLSARAYNRILKVSRTIADLDSESSIKEEHVSEAIQYRSSEENVLKGGF